MINRCLLILLLTCRICNAQNLVTNGGFENYSQLPNGAGEWNFCIGWSNCGGFGSPDYDNTNGSGQAQLPNPFPCTVYPHGGSGVMGFCLYDETYPDFREYVSRALSSPLTVGQNYQLTFYVTNGMPPIYYGGDGCDHFSVAFSTDSLLQTNPLIINFTPQFIYNGFLYNHNWQQVTFNFTADSAYQYITFGSFVDDAVQQLHVFDTASYITDVYYFIDDITLQQTSAAPPVAGFLTSDTALCPQTCISFSNLSTNATSWNWFFPGAYPSSDTTANPQNICYLDSGSFDVTLVAINNAGADTLKLSNYIKVYTGPPTPLITQQNDTLYCSFDSSYASYQWYDDTTLISGATNGFLVISQTGNYNVQVTNKVGCSIAVGINIILGLSNHITDNSFFISPNPVADELFISGNLKSGTESGRVTIFNVLGEEMYAEEISSNKETINCGRFPSGIYFLQVDSETGRWTGKFIKK